MHVDPHEIGSEFVPWVAEVPAEATRAARSLILSQNLSASFFTW